MKPIARVLLAGILGILPAPVQAAVPPYQVITLGEFASLEARGPTLAQHQFEVQVMGPIGSWRVFSSLRDHSMARGDLVPQTLRTGALGAVRDLRIATGNEAIPGRLVPAVRPVPSGEGWRSDPSGAPLATSVEVARSAPGAYEVRTRRGWEELSYSIDYLSSTTVNEAGTVRVRYEPSHLPIRQLRFQFDVRDPRGVRGFRCNYPYTLIEVGRDRIRGTIELQRVRALETFEMTYRISVAQAWSQEPERVDLHPFVLRPDAFLLQVPVPVAGRAADQPSPVLMARPSRSASRAEAVLLGQLRGLSDDPGERTRIGILPERGLLAPGLRDQYEWICGSIVPEFRENRGSYPSILLWQFGLNKRPEVVSRDYSLVAARGRVPPSPARGSAAPEEPLRRRPSGAVHGSFRARRAPRYLVSFVGLGRSPTDAAAGFPRHVLDACHGLQRSIAREMATRQREGALPSGTSPGSGIAFEPRADQNWSTHAAVPAPEPDEPDPSRFDRPALATPEYLTRLAAAGRLGDTGPFHHPGPPAGEVLVFLGGRAGQPTFCLVHGSPWTGNRDVLRQLEIFGIDEPAWIARAEEAQPAPIRSLVLPLDLLFVLALVLLPWVGFLQRHGSTVADLCSGLRTMHKVTLVCALLPPLQGVCFVTLVASVAMTVAVLGTLIVSTRRLRPWSPVETSRPAFTAAAATAALRRSRWVTLGVALCWSAYTGTMIAPLDTTHWSPVTLGLACAALGILAGHVHFLGSLALADRSSSWVPFQGWPILGVLLSVTCLTRTTAMDPPVLYGLGLCYLTFQCTLIAWLRSMDLGMRTPDRRMAGRIVPPAALLDPEPVPGLEMQKLEQVRGNCPVCSTEVPDDRQRPCPCCQAAHHVDCWDYYGGCAIFGCHGGQPPG